MFEVDSDIAPSRSRPRTITVLGLILTAAIVFSYLVAYAVMNALASAGVIDPMPRDYDPRPRWMLSIFSTMVSAFTVLAGMFKWASSRQMKRIDETAEGDDT